MQILGKFELFVRLFHSPQFIMTPPIYDFLKISQPLPFIQPPTTITVGRVPAA